MPNRATIQSGKRRPRVLLGAYACAPDQGSEPGVGWNRALQAARYCDTWVLCEDARYGTQVREYLSTHGPIPGLQVVSVPRSSWQHFLGRCPGLGYLAYNLWQRSTLQVARQLHARVGFDLVHQVTFCGYREPGYLWKLGVPFVWGPVGGTQNYPGRFLRLAGWRGALSESTRSTLNHLQLNYSPGIRRAVRGAAALLAANTTVQRDFVRAHGVEPILQLETGLREVNDHPPPRPDDGILRLLWSGDLEPWKALPLFLHALARMPGDVSWEARILGRGSLESSMRQLAVRLGVNERIRWSGRLPYAEALREYHWADAFVFTSLRDTSGNVVLESLAAGVPVVCLDHQGVHDMVTPECALTIPVSTPTEVIPALTDSLVRLARDPDLRRRMSESALERARYYSWDHQGERMLAVYRNVLGDGFHWEPRNPASSQPAVVGIGEGSVR